MSNVPIVRAPLGWNTGSYATLVYDELRPKRVPLRGACYPWCDQGVLVQTTDAFGDVIVAWHPTDFEVKADIDVTLGDAAARLDRGYSSDEQYRICIGLEKAGVPLVQTGGLWPVAERGTLYQTVDWFGELRYRWTKE